MIKSITQEVVAGTFLAFRTSAKICVLKAQCGDKNGFNKFLELQLKHQFGTDLSLGWINTQKLNYRSLAIQDFVKNSIPKLGLQATNTVLPGYYLFQDGQLIAYHPATINPNTKGVEIHAMAAISGAIAGLIIGLAEKDAAKGLEVFLETMDASVGFKVFLFFKEILGANDATSSQKRQKAVYEAELENAYKLLNVYPTATDPEVAKAWKVLLRQHHPDLHPNDVEAKTRYCRELNTAYDLIKKSRAGKKSAQSI